MILQHENIANICGVCYPEGKVGKIELMVEKGRVIVFWATVSSGISSTRVLYRDPVLHFEALADLDLFYGSEEITCWY